ncbi:MAG: dephospho-CoA kinase [Candidatus Latescibacteria bacterium]|nr:dephospho-CoA kinase [Candidatus Latescibacterota bacterium]
MGRRDRTFVMGIAGASGSGKSTVAAHLAQRFGGVHVDGDRVAHDVLSGDASVIARIRDAFGGEVFDASSRIDRRRLGRVAFGDPAALTTLNAIVHPAVVARCAEAVVRARVDGAPLVVVDAALILEVPMPFGLDLTIALTCDRAVRMRRLLGKGGWSEDEVHARLDRQEGMEKHFYKADAVVDTGRELSAVLADVDARVEAAMARG